MFAPTISLEVGRREETPPRPQKATRTSLAKHAKRSVATLVTCMLTLGLAMAGHAQTVRIEATNSPVTEGPAGTSVNADFNVSLTSAPSTPVTVYVSTADGTAKSSAGDYTATPAGNPGANPPVPAGIAVNFAAGEVGPKTVSIPVLGDDVYEAGTNNNRLETFSLTATSASDGISTTNATATASIRDDEARPIISISDPTPVTEGNTGTTNVAFTVTLSGPSQTATTATYNTSADPSNPQGSATPGQDFQSATNQTVTIPALSTQTIINIPVIGDTRDEATETFILTLSNPNGADLGNNVATATINDDDGPAITINDVTAEEGGELRFFVSLSAPSPEAITINYTVSDRTAKSGEDYTGTTSGQITFPANTTNQNITIQSIDDDLVEGNEFFVIDLSGASGGVTFNDSQGIGTIEDNEDPPVISVSNVRKSEGDSGTITPFNFTVNLSTPTVQTVTVRYRTVTASPNPATAGTDFRPTSGTQTLSFPPGSTQRTVTVNVIGDDTDEPDENFGVEFSQPNNAEFSGTGSTLVALGTIINDDGPTISFVNQNVSVNEGNAGARNKADFGVRLSAPSNHIVTVRYAVNRGATNPATIGKDLTAASGTLTFSPGQTSKTISVEIRGDDTNELDETFEVDLSNPVGGTILSGQQTAVGTILDDDAAPVVSIGDVTANEGRISTTTTFEFGVSLDRVSSQPVTVNFATADITATSVTGPSGPDYVTNSGTVTFNPGETRKSVKIRVNGDNLDEPTETFRVDLTTPVNATLSPRDSSGIGTIRDDDKTPELTIDRSGLSVQENGAPVAPATKNQINFTVSLSAASGNDVSFRYQTVDPTAISQQNRPATQGSDYESASGVITIPAGQTTATVPVVITGDTLDEYDEYFFLVISEATNATINRSTAIGIILDDDAAPTVKIAAPAADQTAVEGGRNASFPVTLSAASGRDVTVNFVIQPDGATNQATPSADLAPINQNTGETLKGQTTGSIVIPAGALTRNITIVGLADKLDEPDPENYRVTITGTNPQQSGPANTADSTAASTLADRTPGFASFTPREGNESYNDANDNGTLVTLTGNQFRINNVSQVREVRFGVTTSDLNKSTAASFFRIDSDTQITARVPNGAHTGKIRIVLTDGTILTPSDNQADVVFYVNAVITSFTPNRGVPRKTTVTIVGRNFNDTKNPIVGVRFGNIVSNANTAGVSPDIRSTSVKAVVPDGATTDKLYLITRYGNGATLPPSIDNFIVDNATVGGLKFAATPTYNVPENAEGDVANPQNPVPISTYPFNGAPASYVLQLDPSIQSDPAGTQLSPRGSVTVRISITDNVAAGNPKRLPQIYVPTGRNAGIRGQNVDVVFAANAFEEKKIYLIDAGDDAKAPDFVTGAGGAGTSGQTPVQLTLTATILRTNDQAAYPVGAKTPTDITINRLDIHGLDADNTAVLRTTEDQNSPDNITSFKVNLANINNGVDVAADGKPVVNKTYSARPQQTFLNADGTVNIDAEPIADVILPFQVNDTTEALIRYFVRIPNGKGGFTTFYPDGMTFGPKVNIIYSKSVNNEYYKYDHFIEVKGVDDNLPDGPTEFQINLLQVNPDNQNGNAIDSEYNDIKLIIPFTLTNSDNEQGQDPDSAGFSFTHATGLTTDEGGKTDFFTVRLRTEPAAGTKVVLRLRTNNPNEVQFVDPKNSKNKLETLDLTFFPTDVTQTGTQSKYDKPITVRVVGVDDNEIDGPQTATIMTNVLNSGTTDSNYQGLDPADPVVTNADNETTGVTVSVRRLDLDEGSTDSFTVRLGAAPTQNVTFNVSSSNSNVARVLTGSRITFTPDNYATPQTISVNAPVDSTFTQTRTATIILSNTTSADPNYDNLDVPDVAVSVTNKTQAYIVTPTGATDTGITTSEDGTSVSLGIRLAAAPIADVTLTLNANSSEVVLSAPGKVGEPITLTFTPQNFATAQVVTVRGVDDDIDDGDQTYTITGIVSSDDAVYQAQQFPSITGTNVDNDGTSTNGSTTFAANGTYSVSFPYAAGTSASATLTQSQAFSLASGSGNANYTLFRFVTESQRNDRAVNGGGDFVLVGASEKLMRGVGYRLITGNNDVKLNTPADVSTLKPYAGTTFSLPLNWNKNFIDDTGALNNSNNGYNFIGFPFDPTKYSRVSFSSSQVKYGSDTYETITAAAAAGIIDQKLYTMDATGNLTAVDATDVQIRPYRAYFVHILRNDFPVVLTLRNPAS